jgi:hypothetical protein
MTFKKEIEQYLEQIRILEETFRKVQNMDILPLSFFSASIDVLNKLKAGVYELESAQLQLMADHLKDTEGKAFDAGISNLNRHSTPDVESTDTCAESPIKSVAATTPDTSGFLGDAIAKKIYSDFTKSLNLNQRFMFQRDLFHGDAVEMNKALVQLNTFQCLEDALNYLNENYVVRWESDSGSAFRELLDRRFI